MSPGSKVITVAASILFFSIVMSIVGSATDSEIFIGTATYVIMTCDRLQADLIIDMLPCLLYSLGISVPRMIPSAAVAESARVDSFMVVNLAKKREGKFSDEIQAPPMGVLFVNRWFWVISWRAK